MTLLVIFFPVTPNTLKSFTANYHELNSCSVAHLMLINF